MMKTNDDNGIAMGSKQAKERTNKKILAAYVEKRRHREF
jgi:hypothetical protein